MTTDDPTPNSASSLSGEAEHQPSLRAPGADARFTDVDDIFQPLQAADGRSTPAAPATSVKLGELADATPDTMTLHTRDAYRMFTGRSADASGQASPIPGGRRFAAVMKSICSTGRPGRSLRYTRSTVSSSLPTTNIVSVSATAAEAPLVPV